jgi:hypothetical protein
MEACSPSHLDRRIDNVLSFQALFDLEATNNELKADLRDLYITGAREIDIPQSNRKAIIIHVSRCTLARRRRENSRSLAHRSARSVVSILAV